MPKPVHAVKAKHVAMVRSYGTSQGVALAWQSRPRAQEKPEAEDDTAGAPAAPETQGLMRHYRVATAEMQRMADLSEQRVASALKASTTKNNAPFDVTIKRTAIEVKTLLNSVGNKVIMRKECLARKNKALRAGGFKRGLTVVLDLRKGKGAAVYVRKGFGNFRTTTMTKLGGLDDLRVWVK
ncbi:MAG: hypothetical protein KGL39_30570 [Patescibacteria group bacterium]|nr:hypothetical protein [Patescibacteria group bacterium]